MSILVNPSNNTVEVDDQTLVKNVLKRPGYRLATESEIEQFYAKSNIPKQSDTSIYLVTAAVSNDGYGQSQLRLIDSMAKAGVQLSKEYHNQNIGLVYSHPDSLKLLNTKIKVLYTMFESSRIPEEWLDWLKLADKVLVPSRFCQSAFAERGVETEVVPLGYAPDAFYPSDEPKDDSVFTFLHYNAFNTRKGWDLVFKAFTEEFGDDPSVRLVMKTISDVIKVPIPKSQYPNIDVIRNQSSLAELRKLICASDAFVFPSRGEGFGLTPLEALACGVPGIIPNGSGMSEYFDNRYFLGVKHYPIPPMYENRRFNQLNVGQMIECDIDDLRKQMRYAYENRDKMKAMGKAGAEWVKANYTIDHTAKKLIEKLSQFESKADGIVASRHQKKKLSIVVLTHNAVKYTKKAVKSIQDNTVIPYELIIIDNCSTDGTQEYLEQLKADGVISTLILNEENRGVAGGRNQGVAEATGDIVVFLDNDVEVKSNWDLTISQHLDDPKVAIVGKMGVNVVTFRPLIFEKPTSYPAEVDVVAGFCFAFRREMVEILGDQYEDFPNKKFWHEDLEFCTRAKFAGYKIIGDADIPLVHYEHKSAGDGVTNIGEVYPGFYENADVIFKRYISKNQLIINQDWKGFDNRAAFERIIHNISTGLRQKGMIVVRKPSIRFSGRSFDQCKGMDFYYEGNRFVSLYQENDKPPAEWALGMAHVDVALAGSGHVMEACKNEDYADKLVNLNLASIDPKIFNFNVEPLADFYGDKFKFLFVGATQPRKNTENLIKWYCETYTSNDNVVLIIKDGGYGQVEKTKEYLQKYARNGPEIAHIVDDWSDRYLAQVYKTVGLNGCYISPHRAEGFGLPLIETLACGCRVGTTNWGGPKYILNKKDGTPKSGVTMFDYKLAPSSFHNHRGEPYYQSSESPMWAEPKESDVKRFMITIVDEPYNAKQMKFASQNIINSFSTETVVNNLYKYLHGNI